MSTLPTGIVERIEKEAEDIFPKCFASNVQKNAGYIEGATKEAEKSAKLVEALEKIKQKYGDLGIPYHAYGDNEAACRMAIWINEVMQEACNALKEYNQP